MNLMGPIHTLELCLKPIIFGINLTPFKVYRLQKHG
uniref:Uncharacterized protein n=1 Tax=Anguilla anguilla TaxID=7936 RepID=A0A0E9RR16_ANGAN